MNPAQTAALNDFLDSNNADQDDVQEVSDPDVYGVVTIEFWSPATDTFEKVQIDQNGDIYG